VAAGSRLTLSGAGGAPQTCGAAMSAIPAAIATGVRRRAPAIGLPPELPGIEAAALQSRQLWWVATAVATAAPDLRRGDERDSGGDRDRRAAQGDQREAGGGGDRAKFAARSLAIAFVFWAVLGLGFGWAWTAVARGRPGRRPSGRWCRRRG
jgi:hypothetical protein